MRSPDGRVFPITALLVLAISASLSAIVYADSDSTAGPDGETVRQTFFIPGATFTIARLAIEAATFQHPHVGTFNVRLSEDLEPAVTDVSWSLPDGTLLTEHPSTYFVTGVNQAISGRITVSSQVLGGIVYTAGGDLELDARWTPEGLRGSWTGGVPLPEGDEGNAEREEHGVPGHDSDLLPTSHSHMDTCDRMVLEGQLPPTTDCGALEEQALDPLVGDDYEGLSPLGSQSAQVDVESHPLKARIYHEGKLSRILTDCNEAEDRIFVEETVARLQCSIVDVGPYRHDQGTSNGYDDWKDFLDDYYNGLYSYRSSAIAYNSGRFVLFMPDESYLHNGVASIAGAGEGCDNPSWAASTRSSLCGQGLVYNRAGAYHVHSVGYREGQTLAHELIHMLGVVGPDAGDHDESWIRKNYNGRENCSGWGNDFTTHNTFSGGSKGTACDHRHYWISSEIETDVNTNVAIHASHYP